MILDGATTTFPNPDITRRKLGVVGVDDVRLSDAREAVAHEHEVREVSGLETTLIDIQAQLTALDGLLDLWGYVVTDEGLVVTDVDGEPVFANA